MNEGSDRTVLVTGAGGFIGAHLAADQAQRGSRVVALDLHLDRVRHLEAPGRFELIEGDVADPEVQKRAMQDAQVVFHLAAAHLSVTAGEDEFRRINVEAVRSLLRLASAGSVVRFVHCSSVGVYGRIADPPADEETPCRPEIAYERTKLAGEREVLRAIEERGLPAVIVRPVWVYGPGCPRTEKLFRAIARGRFIMAGDGSALRHCVYIRDMVRAFELAATSGDAAGQTLIVGDREAVSVRELLQGIARITGARAPRSVPSFLLATAGLVAEAVFGLVRREPPLSRRTLRFFTSNTSFDISRARRKLGYEPEYDLESGLRETQRILSAPEPWQVPLARPAVQ
jgi:nucleoside-diphosphate-sugar epimerase